MFNFFKRKQEKPPVDAEQLHHEARVLGQAGKYDAAIEKLRAAIAAKPDWAYPYYDLAFTYFLKGDSELALTYYRQTDAMEPRGFFTAKTAIYALEGEATGKFPKAYMQIEWTDDHAQKLALATALTQQVPEFAPGWKELAVLADNGETQLHAILQGLAKNPDAETKGILLLNKAGLLNANGRQDAAKQLLQDMIADVATTKTTLAMAKFVLQNFG